MKQNIDWLKIGGVAVSILSIAVTIAEAIIGPKQMKADIAEEVMKQVSK